MARLPYLEKQDLAPENQDLLAREINLAKLLAHSPDGARNYSRLGSWIRHQSKLDGRLRELAILQVGFLTKSEYEYSHHIQIGREFGLIKGGPVRAAPLLEVNDLRVVFELGSGLLAPKRTLVAVNGVSFDIAHGETLAIVGESGSGKSTIARALMRLLRAESGTVRLDGEDITSLKGKALRRVRPKMQMVFQDPYSSLDPSKLVVDIVGEPLAVHQRLSRREMFHRVQQLLEQVGLGAHHMNRYPYEFSGGQRQRLAIARAISLQPKLLVLDEAVSALDVSTQNQILNLLEDLRREHRMAYLFISHDLGVVQHIADRVAVTYLGRVIETGPAAIIFERCAHPYTEALLSAVPVPNPDLQQARKRHLLHGDIPSPLAPPTGCPFHTRCPYVMDVCSERMPDTTSVAGGGTVACHLQTLDPALGGRSLKDLVMDERTTF